jgi:hypothetical protein
VKLCTFHGVHLGVQKLGGGPDVLPWAAAILDEASGFDRVFFRWKIFVERAFGYAAPSHCSFHACRGEAAFVEAIKSAFYVLEPLSLDGQVLTRPLSSRTPSLRSLTESY